MYGSPMIMTLDASERCPTLHAGYMESLPFLSKPLTVVNGRRAFPLTMPNVGRNTPDQYILFVVFTSLKPCDVFPCAKCEEDTNKTSSRCTLANPPCMPTTRRATENTSVSVFHPVWFAHDGHKLSTSLETPFCRSSQGVCHMLINSPN